MKKILLSSLLLISGLSQAADQTNQYAYGAMIELSNSESMYNRIELTGDIYTQALSSTLDDVRVFNQKGQPVPFALANVYQQNDENQTFPVTVYSLDNHQENDNNNNQEDEIEGKKLSAIGQYNININNKNIQINLDNANKPNEYHATYLLQIPSEIKLGQPFSRLSIDFEEMSNWQATANLLYSNDLKKWQTAIDNVPIMSLTDNNNNQSLNVNTIDLPSGMNFKSIYWILQLKSDKQLIPSIKTVKFTSRKATPVRDLYPIDLNLISADEQEATYQLSTSLPIKQLTIKLQNERTVLPATIFYKTSDNDKTWHKLDDYIFRSINDTNQSQTININNSILNIKQLKIKAINASLDNPPSVTAYLYRMRIIFNSANNGPFILAWGSPIAKPASLSEKALLSDTISAQDVPEAYLGDKVKLGNREVLSQTDDNSSKSSSLSKWLIWGVLIAGALFLMLLALKLLKEVKKAE
ncbi:DUF3999 family protein [Gilliamella apicola]|uniref:DUF3999 domain-containing protein n=1 Tax=Gilliamella apicola TaxID=1196095 RepID=A0A2V4EEM4_9GAMM|nr:DUF3999 family protein [Gilliamella apicola]PXZ06797.1 hypothetical protein DKK79_01355 [Gilliamella apicola]